MGASQTRFIIYNFRFMFPFLLLMPYLPSVHSTAGVGSKLPSDWHVELGVPVCINGSGDSHVNVTTSSTSYTVLIGDVLPLPDVK